MDRHALSFYIYEYEHKGKEIQTLPKRYAVGYSPQESVRPKFNNYSRNVDKELENNDNQ